MDASFVLAAVIFTLLAIVVATSMFTGTSPSSDYGRRAAGRVTEEESASPGKHNGHGPCSAPEPQPRKTAEFDWTEMSGSSHDHWDVVKNVQSVSKTLDSNSSSFRYLPGKSRSHHFQMMMSKDELEEEQRNITDDFTSSELANIS
uniref:Uncharacterized protein n=1 Tax=Periophthalmus magnuspinnatus TaxID=409849 RepID=A0A3B4A937_9GOBI